VELLYLFMCRRTRSTPTLEPWRVSLTPSIAERVRCPWSWMFSIAMPAPGTFPTVKWPVRSLHPSLLVPKTSLVTATGRTFLIRDRNGHAEWVDVKKGAAEGDLVAVSGALHAGDMVVRRGTDVLREGASIGGER